MSLPHLLLMLDDDRATTKNWTDIAVHFGWQPLVANSVSEFRDHLRYASPAVALIDLSMHAKDRMNREGMAAFDAAYLNGTTYCVVASNWITFEDGRIVLSDRGGGVRALKKEEIGTTDTFVGLLSDGYAWSLAARAPLSASGPEGQNFRTHIAESICGPAGVGILTQHTGLMGAQILDSLAAALGDLAPFCVRAEHAKLEQGDGFVHTELWSTTRARSLWIGISSIPPNLEAGDLRERLVQVSRSMRHHLEQERGRKFAAVAQAFRLVEHDGLVFGMIGTAEPRESFREFVLPYWMKRLKS